MARPARIDIHLSALRHNYQLAKTLAKDNVLAVLKANAYGHGALPIANALVDIVDGFAVACIEEALELRQAGIELPIVLLEGFFETCELALIDHYRLDCVIHHPEQVTILQHAQLKQPIRCWLKLDSGMHRIGLDASEYLKAYQQLQDCSNVQSVIHMTHFSCADHLHSDTTLQQIETFNAATQTLPQARSLQNSAGILAWPQAGGDWARAGLLLYGISPFSEYQQHAAQLQPVMCARSRLIATQWLKVGDAIGYGQTYTATSPMRIGVVAFGYADGYPMRAPSGTPVQVAGVRSQLVGRVSMDMLTVDITSIAAAKVGSEVLLWGQGLPLEAITQQSGDIPYTILCHTQRAPFYYHA